MSFKIILVHTREYYPSKDDLWDKLEDFIKPKVFFETAGSAVFWQDVFKATPMGREGLEATEIAQK